MRPKRYFQLSFLLPIVLPLIITLFFEVGFQGWSNVVLLFWGSLVIGGIPYSIFLVGLFFWMRNKDYKAIQRLTFVVPLLFVLVFILGAVFIVVPLQILKFGEARVEGDGLFSFCVLILILGYFYVLLTNGGFYLLKYLGYIEEEAEWERALPKAEVNVWKKR